MRFTIITATKNNKAGLLRAIECVRNQSYKNIEHIVVDGGSTDGTVQILRHFDKLSAGSAQKDSLLSTQYSLLSISEADSGIYDAINKGIKQAKGDVIGLLHSDDLYADENVISKYAEVFEGSDTEAVYSDLVYVSKKLEVRSQKLEDKSTNNENTLPVYSLLTTDYSIIRYWRAHSIKELKSREKSWQEKKTDYYLLFTNSSLLNGWMPPHPTLFIRREIFEKYGLYNTYLKIASDYEMILRLFFTHKITTSYLPITSYFMHLGGASNKSISNIIQKSREDYIAMKQNEIPLPFITLVSKNLRKLHQFLVRDL